ncbi:MAG: hypothetical protein MRERV_20c023 [Mycoplasmataceae bacterium RV_VA103A]|nr:MAG: hypothetical protein MRERV_20c023 [Mycoplasmataceae bacterium RV_VA103A]
MRRIREKYEGDLAEIKLEKFDFGKEREELWAKYLAESK